jgi:hypothetical protein
MHDFKNEPYLTCYELENGRYAIKSIETLEDGTTVRASEEDRAREITAQEF